METVQTANPPTFESVWAGLQEVKQILKENAEERKEWQKENAEQLKEWKRENAERQKEWQRETAERQKENTEARKETDWIVKENAEQLKEWKRENSEARKEIDRILKESAEMRKETDRILKESAWELKEWKKENARQQKEYYQRFGEFTNRFGEVVEYMVAPNMQNKFWELGLTFNIVIPDYCLYYPEKVLFLQTDVYLENGDKAMLVEVKTKLNAQDVKDHIKRLEKMRKYADLRGDKRTFLGAVAGVVIKPNVKEYALKQGFYVVEPSGETFNITPPNGKPKEW